jgi:hypothetical protein
MRTDTLSQSYREQGVSRVEVQASFVQKQKEEISFTKMRLTTHIEVSNVSGD